MLEEARVGMFDDALLAKLLHHSVTLQRHRAVLDVQLLQVTTIIGNALQATIANHFTTFQTQLSKAAAMFAEHLQAKVSHITFADV